jgi:hypothetical protein
MPSQKQTAPKQREAENVTDKVEQLVQLATRNDNENEAAAAAMTAVKLMSEHRLTVIPQDDLEAAQRVINGAQELVKKAEEKANGKLVMGVIAGMLLGGRTKLF